MLCILGFLLDQHRISGPDICIHQLKLNDVAIINDFHNPSAVRHQIFLARIHIGRASAFTLSSLFCNIGGWRSLYLSLVVKGTEQWQNQAVTLKTSVQTTCKFH